MWRPDAPPAFPSARSSGAWARVGRWSRPIISLLRRVNSARCSSGSALDSLAAARERPCRYTVRKEHAVGETVRIVTPKEELELPMVTGTEGERGVDISNLRAKTGLVTLDPAFMNTPSPMSAITHTDGKRSIIPTPSIPTQT